jgi:Domain of unknown function (DUF4926)
MEMHSIVALLEDLPSHGLLRGQVGTIVADWAPNVYEVEFADNHGVPYAMVALHTDQLIQLHHEPAQRAA